MIDNARNDVLNTIQEAIAALKNKRYTELHAISDHVLHVIAVYQDADIVNLAVSIYALSKILETEKYRNQPKIKIFLKNILQLLQTASGQLKKENYSDFSETLSKILDSIEGFSASIKFYIENILHFARIKKGTKLYEHGLSLGKAAELAGVTKWELMPAIGETAIHEQVITLQKLNARRLDFIGKVFKPKKKCSGLEEQFEDFYSGIGELNKIEIFVPLLLSVLTYLIMYIQC